MAHSLYDRTIAFAGICQAVTLVQQVAKSGHCDPQAFEVSLKAIANTSPANTLDVYGCEENLKIGLTFLANDMMSKTQQSNEMTRYLVSLMSLERKLSKTPQAMATLGQRIALIERQLDHFNLMDEQMLSNLASVYLDVISPIGTRIQVVGSPEQLQQPHNQQKIRALLLSGFRSAVLWRQVGGKRRHLLFGRKMLQEAATILDRI